MMVYSVTKAAQNFPAKNYIINGAMIVSQENGSTALTATGTYPVDRFNQEFVLGTGTASVAQVASPTPSGSPNRVRVTVTAAQAAMTTTQHFQILQSIEGLRIAGLMFGSATAKTVVARFGVRAPAGTYGVSLAGSGSNNRLYVAEFTVASGEADTDVVKSVVIPGDVAGTWLTDNTKVLSLHFCMGTGPTYQGTAGVWGTTNILGTSNQFNLFGTNGNIFELFDVGLYEGSVAPPFVVPDYASELALCKRYLLRRNFSTASQYVATLQAVNATTATGLWFPFSEMRVAPTASVSSPTHFMLQGSAGGGAACSTLALNTFVDQVHVTSAVAAGLVAGNATAMYTAGPGWVQMDAR
jgi:hypothetical protein